MRRPENEAMEINDTWSAWSEAADPGAVTPPKMARGDERAVEISDGVCESLTISFAISLTNSGDFPE